jgi:ABC-type glycerol-3-phosphate transport system substrate-binding protein
MAAWAPDPSIQAVIDEYNEAHTNYQIQLKIYYEPQDSDEEVYQAIDRMTMDLTTGNAPDLFSLNSMDIMSLENVGLLMDLNPLMAQDVDFHREDFLENIWSLYERDGCLYELVPTFCLSGIMAPASLVTDRVGWTYDEWLALDQKHLLNENQEGLLTNMILYSAGEFVDLSNADCFFDSNQFLEWMEVIRSAPAQKDYESTTYESAMFVSGIEDYAASIYSKGTDIAYCGFPSSNAQGPAIIAKNSYGISSTTKYPEACWEFLKYFLDDSVYERLEGDGFPAKKSILAQELAAAQLPLDDENSLFRAWSENEIAPLTEENADYILNLLENIDHCAFRYNAISDIITEEISAYLSGDKSAEDVAKLIQNRAHIYLSEQS